MARSAAMSGLTERERDGPTSARQLAEARTHMQSVTPPNLLPSFGHPFRFGLRLRTGDQTQLSGKTGLSGNALERVVNSRSFERCPQKQTIVGAADRAQSLDWNATAAALFVT